MLCPQGSEKAGLGRSSRILEHLDMPDWWELEGFAGRTVTKERQDLLFLSQTLNDLPRYG